MLCSSRQPCNQEGLYPLFQSAALHCRFQDVLPPGHSYPCRPGPGGIHYGATRFGDCPSRPARTRAIRLGDPGAHGGLPLRGPACHHGGALGGSRGTLDGLLASNHDRSDGCWKTFSVAVERGLVRTAGLDPDSPEARPFSGRGKPRLPRRTLALPRVLSVPRDPGEEMTLVHDGEPALASRICKSQLQTIAAVLDKRARNMERATCGLRTLSARSTPASGRSMWPSQGECPWMTSETCSVS